MRFCLLFLAGLAGCSAQTWPAPWESEAKKASVQAAKEVLLRAEYADGRPAVAITLRVADVSEMAWFVGTRVDGTAPLITSGLPLVSFKYRRPGEGDDVPLHDLLPGRRYGNVYVVTIPEAK